MDIAGYSVLFLVEGGYQGGETGMKKSARVRRAARWLNTIQLAITAARYARMTIGNDDATRRSLPHGERLGATGRFHPDVAQYGRDRGGEVQTHARGDREDIKAITGIAITITCTLTSSLDGSWKEPLSHLTCLTQTYANHRHLPLPKTR